MPITISGSTGISGVDGTASSPALQGADTDTGVFYPAANQVAIATGGVQRLLVDATGTVTTGVGALYPLVSGTAVASTSGTSIDFTGIPSWVKRVTVMFSGVSTNGANSLLVQLGDSGGIENTGYVSTSIQAALTDSSTAGFIIRSAAATNLFSGSMVIKNINGNEWVSDHVVKQSTTANAFGAGDKTLSATLDRVRITTVGGTDTFDAGSINILYE
jgi:hypothetical protein